MYWFAANLTFDGMWDIDRKKSDFEFDIVYGILHVSSLGIIFDLLHWFILLAEFDIWIYEDFFGFRFCTYFVSRFAG